MYKLEKICGWKEIIQTKKELEGYQIKCRRCDGYNERCIYYKGVDKVKKND